MPIQPKRPCECTENEIREFVSEVKKGNEVESSGLINRVKNADILVFARDTNLNLIGVGAVKCPKRSYLNRIFSKAGVSAESSKYKLEIGYFYVDPNYRKNGIGSKIMQAINQHLHGENCFATTKSDTMQNILTKYGFQKIGKEYKSDSGDYKLELYINGAY